MKKETLKQTISTWISEIDQAETLPADISALNFGLYEPYGIELIGAEAYDPEDDDWACVEDFVLEQRSCKLDLDSSIGWEEVQGVVHEILTELVAERKDIKLFSAAHITTGFCDGELIVVK